MKSLIDIYEIAVQKNITVDCYTFSSLESMSLMDDDGECFVAIDPFKLQSEQDEKMKLAHELGHCITGSFYNPYSKLDTRERHEYRAYKWSFKELVPYDDLVLAANRGCVEVWEFAEYFDVPVDFMSDVIEYYENGNM